MAPIKTASDSLLVPNEITTEPLPAIPTIAPVATPSAYGDSPAPGSHRKTLFIAVVTVLVILGCYNVLIRYTSRSSLRQQLLARLQHIPPQTDCIFLGNSLVEAGCDVDSFSAAWPSQRASLHTINLALGATLPVEHYLILKKALEQPLHLKYLIYGFFDDQLNASSSGDWSDLVGNRAFAYYFPEDAAKLYSPGSKLKEWQLELTASVPMLSERSSLWGKVELLRRKLEDIGMPKQKVNRFGRVQDFAALEATDVPSFNRRCTAVVQKKVGLAAPIKKIIELAREHGATVVLVEMPMPSRHRTVFYSSPAWSELRGYLQTLAREQHLVYFPASDWVKNDADFEDVTHLNEQGAKVFSAKLASAIAQLPTQQTTTHLAAAPTP